MTRSTFSWNTSAAKDTWNRSIRATRARSVTIPPLTQSSGLFHSLGRHEQVPCERVDSLLGEVVGEHVPLCLVDDLARVAEQVVAELVRQGEPDVTVGEVAAGHDEGHTLAVYAQSVRGGSQWGEGHVDPESAFNQAGEVTNLVVSQAKLGAHRLGQPSPLTLSLVSVTRAGRESRPGVLTQPRTGRLRNLRRHASSPGEGVLDLKKLGGRGRARPGVPQARQLPVLADEPWPSVPRLAGPASTRR